MSEVDGIILKSDRIIASRPLSQEMLGRIHTGHIGTEKNTRWARGIIFRPEMDAQVDEIVPK